jgi:hypothetical protein
LDESTNISNEAELVVFVRVPDIVEIVEQILFCKCLKGNATGRAVFEVINDFFNEKKNQVAAIFKEKSVSEFWCEVSKDYPSLGRSAVTALLPFGSTYLCQRTLFCHGINQDQAEKLPAAGTRIDPRRQ